MEVLQNAGNQPPPLIFDQKGWRPSRWRLGWFVFISLLGHVGVFYLFKVVTPITTKRLPPEESVLILRGSDPESAQILASLEDRSPAQMLVSLTPTDQRNLPQLALPDYTPSYKGYQPNYQFQWEPALGPLPSLAAADRPLLPPSGSGLRKDVVKSSLPVSIPPELVLGEALAKRGLTEPPVWPADGLATEERNEPHVFRLAVTPSGLVKYCLSEGSNRPASLEKMLQQLRFKPVKSEENQWGEVEVR